MNCLVSGYERPCYREAGHQDPVSPGRVGDDEVLCRGGFTQHNKNGSPKIGLIRANELANGQLSVWRIRSGDCSDLAEVVDLLRERKPAANDLLWVFGVSAAELRGLVANHPICAIDDTDCGPDWARHKRHCTLAPCSETQFSDLEDPSFLAMRRALHEAFAKRQLWSAAG